MRSRKSTNICAGNIGAGKTRRFRRPRGIHPVSNPCQSAPLRETSRGNAVSSRPRNLSISLILCSDSPRKSSGLSSPILTLHTCCTAKEPREDIYRPSDPRGVRPHRPDEGDHRVHLLPPFRPGDGNAPGSSSHQEWQQTFEPLVHPESLLDASSESFHRGPVDFDRTRLEGVCGSAWEPVGSLAQNSAYTGARRHAAANKNSRKDANMNKKRIVTGIILIFAVAIAVCAFLRWLNAVHTCDHGVVLQGTNVECPK